MSIAPHGPEQPDSTGTGSRLHVDVDLDRLPMATSRSLSTYPLRRDTDDDTINDNIEVIHETPRAFFEP
jgi:hypothetical protein